MKGVAPNILREIFKQYLHRISHLLIFADSGSVSGFILYYFPSEKKNKNKNQIKNYIDRRCDACCF